MKLGCSSRQALLGALAFFLASCAPQSVLGPGTSSGAPPSAQAITAWKTREARLDAIQSWEIQGRLGVHVGRNGGQLALHWRHSATVDMGAGIAKDEIDGAGPLGKRLFTLMVDANGAELVDDKHIHYAAKDAQQLLFAYTGWRLPIVGLYRWLLGAPLAHSPEQHQLDAAGRLQYLQQLGWEIHYLDYARNGNYELPRKLVLNSLSLANHGAIDNHARSSSPSPVEPAVELRFVIQQWTVK